MIQYPKRDIYHFVKGIDKMKKITFFALCCTIFLLIAMTACTGKASASGSASGEAANDPAVSAGDAVTEQTTAATTTRPVVIEAVTYTWPTAEDSAQYRTGAAARLDEYTDLLFSISGLEDELAGTSPAKLGSNKKYIVLRDSVSSWTRMINNYPTDSLPADCTQIHSLLINLSGATDAYMNSYPDFIASPSSQNQQDQLNAIMDIVVELNGLLAAQ